MLTPVARSSESTRKAVTLKMVAAAAGVSASTVCHVLRGRARLMRIKPDSEERIRKCAAELNYVGNHYARSLVTRTSSTVGLTVSRGQTSFLGTPIWHHIAAGIEVQVRVRGFDLHLIGGGHDVEVLDLAHQELLAKRVDCLLIIPAIYPVIPPALLKPGMPVVFINNASPKATAHVRLDHAPGIEAAVMHLKDLGHRTITWFSTVVDPGSVMESRRDCLRQLLRREGLGYEEVIVVGEMPDPQSTHDTLSDMYQATRAQYRPSAQTTAILCYNDALALIMLKVLSGLDLEVPGDISVIGFDDLFAQFALPALTTISHRLYEMGVAAVDLALELVQGGQKVVRQVTLPATLVVRESTGPARAAR